MNSNDAAVPMHHCDLCILHLASTKLAPKLADTLNYVEQAARQARVPPR